MSRNHQDYRQSRSTSRTMSNFTSNQTDYKNEDQFKKPMPNSRYDPKNYGRKNLPPANYDVYHDGYPVENPPVCVKDIPWNEYTQNNQVFDENLKGLKVFGLARYPPSKKNVGHTKGHIVVQFFQKEDAVTFMGSLKDKVCYSTILTPTFFGDQNNNAKNIYGYPGKNPKMGGLDYDSRDRAEDLLISIGSTSGNSTSHMSVTVSDNSRSVHVNTEDKSRQPPKHEKRYPTKDTNASFQSDRSFNHKTEYERRGPGVRRGFDADRGRRSTRPERREHGEEIRRERRATEVNKKRSEENDVARPEQQQQRDSKNVAKTEVFCSETLQKSGTPMSKQVNSISDDILGDWSDMQVEKKEEEDDILDVQPEEELKSFVFEQPAPKTYEDIPV